MRQVGPAQSAEGLSQIKGQPPPAKGNSARVAFGFSCWLASTLSPNSNCNPTLYLHP